MRKYYYKGESISILLTTQIPEIGDRRKITDYNIESITLQDIIPFIEIIDNYSIKLHLSSTQTKLLKEGIAPIVITLSKDNYTTIGKNIDLYIREIDNGKPIDGVGYLENMILAMNVGDLIFNLSLTQISRSNYEIWLDNGHNGTELDYLSWLRKPSIDASETATVAATEAHQEALLANEAATEAHQEALLANEAATEAHQKALLANEAAESANKSTIDAEQAALDAFEISENPTYIGQDHYVYIYNKQTQSYNKTDIYCKGDAFSVKKTYPSVAAMNADFSGPDTKIGDFVLIESGNVQDPDNSKLYVKTALSWEFLTDLSGAIGFTGKTPQFSIGIVTTSDAGTAAVVTVNDDGVDASGNPKYKINFSIPKGDKGDKGDTGAKGDKGDTGKTAYQYYFETTTDNPKLTETQFASLHAQIPANETARQGAETARNVASNVYNVTLAVPLSAGQYYTSTTARAAVPAGVRKKGLILNYETSAGVWYSERFIGSDVAAWTTAANWLMIPDKSYVDTQISNTLNVISENWVGVIIDPSLSSSEPSSKSTVVAYRATELQRTGNLNYHKFGKSRIFNAFYPAVVNRSTKQIAWRLNKNNPSLKEDGTASNPDWTTQNICIVIPNLYRRIVLLDGNADGKYEIRYDIAPFEGASLFHAESFHSIGDASMDRTNSQLVSVMSNDVRFRGGGNQSAWDAQWRSQLGTPLTDTSRTNFELYANNAGWQTMNIYDWTMFSELAMLYFANTNIQLDYTSVLTAEGYPQGGLGAGNTTWISKRWEGHSGYYPIDKVGEGFMSVGCNVGVKNKTVTDYYRGATTSVAANKLIATGHFSASAGWLASYIGYTIRNISTGLTATIVAKDSDDQLSLSVDIFTATAQVFQIDGVSFTYGIPVFFGLEHLYGHIWKYVSGINYIVQAADAGGRSMAYVNPDWATRSAVDVTNYQYVGDIPRVDGYIKTLFPGWNIVKSNIGGSSTTYMSDYGYHANLPASGQVVRALLVSGSASSGASAGLRYAHSHYPPSNANAHFGARLRAIKL